MIRKSTLPEFQSFYSGLIFRPLRKHYKLTTLRST